MSEPFDTLIQVQNQDTVLEQLHHRISHLPERLELAEIARNRSTVEVRIGEVTAQLGDLTRRQADLERQISATTNRRGTLEDRARTGQVSASRDLQAVDHEIHQLSDRKNELEDQELELMEEQEPVDAELAGLSEELARLDARGDELQQALSGIDAALHAEMAEAERARAAAAAELPAELLTRYEKIRHQLGGIGAARLVGNRCDGCHLTLAPVEVEHLLQRPPDELLTCEQCGRILVR